MIAVKRKAANVITDKALAIATDATYTLNVSDIRKAFAGIFMDVSAKQESPGVKQLIDEESRWCTRWMQDITVQQKEGSTTVNTTPNIIIEKNSSIEYLDSEEISIDLFNDRFFDKTHIPSKDLHKATKIVASGVSNNFRFYNRSNCHLVVLDYRRLMDCLAFFYGYRELGISIAHIEAVLENCSAAVLNPSTELEGLIKYTLGTYKSPTNQYEGLLQRESGLICRDGDMYNLISSLRISTSCFQIIHSTHQVETWQHHKLTLTPNVTYASVLNTSRTEMQTDLLKGLMNEICTNKELQNTKVLCADYGCIALSVPNGISEESLLASCTAQIRLFGRQFLITPRLYTYNPTADCFVEEDR